MSQTDVLLEQTADGVGILIMNRIETHNAFNDTMMKRITMGVRSFIDNPAIKIILIKSAAKHFSAGADLNWMAKAATASHEDNVHDAQTLTELMSTLYRCPKPIIAQVHGAAMGGGLGLVACGHLVVSSDEATFSFSEVKLGLIPSVIGPYVVNAIGTRWARYYFLTAEVFDAHRAQTLGLCHRVVPMAELHQETEQLIQTLLKNGPMALRETNTYLCQFDQVDITPELSLHTAERIAKLRQSSEGKEGIQAFLEKRKPNWVKTS